MLCTQIKGLFLKMTQCSVIAKMQFQHSLITIRFSTNFSLKIFHCSSFLDNFVIIFFYGFFSLVNNEHRTANQLEVFRSVWKNSNRNIQVAPGSLRRSHDVKNSGF